MERPGASPLSISIFFRLLCELQKENSTELALATPNSATPDFIVEICVDCRLLWTTPDARNLGKLARLYESG